MKQNFQIMLALAAVSLSSAAFLTGCTDLMSKSMERRRSFAIKVLSPTEDNSGAEKNGETADTKTLVANNWSVGWSGPDEIAAVINSADATFSYSGGNTFSTTSWTPEEGGEYEWKLLYHPTQDGNFTAKKIGTDEYTANGFTLPINCAQAATNDKSHLGGQPLAGYATTTGTGQPSVRMKHLVTVFAVRVVNSSSKAINVAAVSVENDASAAMSGSFYINPKEGTVQGVSGKTYAYSSVPVTIGAIAAGATGEFYVPSAPFSLDSGSSITVRITDTDGGTVASSKVCGSDVSFNAGTYKTRTVTVKDGDISDARYYSKITGAPELTDGEYLIVCEAKNVAFDGSLSTLDGANNYKSVTISGGKIPSSAALDAASFTYSSSTKSLKSKSGYYIGQSKNANGLETSSTAAYENAVSFDSDGNAVITAKGGTTLRFNSAHLHKID